MAPMSVVSNNRSTSLHIGQKDHLPRLSGKESPTRSQQIQLPVDACVLLYKHFNFHDFPHSRAFDSGRKFRVSEFSPTQHVLRLTVPCPFQSFVNKQLSLLLIGALEQIQVLNFYILTTFGKLPSSQKYLRNLDE